MYESRFGITAPPFQLSPDPSFYFDSQGHHRALADLRAMLENDSGVAVVSGEIGAGKTTLVRTLLGDPDRRQVAVAHVVSTQLDAEQLLAAACIGFGLEVAGTLPDELGRRLLRLLLKLDRERRKALLIIDEAQNLHPGALDKLLLAMGKPARRMPLQLWLVGQPELRGLLKAPEFGTLLSEVRVSCHLGPIEPEETGPYIEHRLGRVGWSGTPRFTSSAFQEVHRWSGGIPRRINLLCNRLMMSCFLQQRDDIDQALVADAAREWRHEIGETGSEPLPAPAPAMPAIHRVPALPDPLMEATQPGALLCIVAGYADHFKAAALMRAFGAYRDLPPATLVRVHDNDALELNPTLFPAAERMRAIVDLGIAQVSPPSEAGELRSAFDLLVNHARPSAAIVFDGSPAALMCATVARARGLPVVHVGAGMRTPQTSGSMDTRMATDDMADLLYTTDHAASEALGEAGVAAERVHCVGNLLIDGMQLALRSRAAPASRGSDGAAWGPMATHPRGYALVSLVQPANLCDGDVLAELLGVLREVSRDIPLVWPVMPHAAAQLRKYRLEATLRGERLLRIPPQPYDQYLRLLRHATCVLTDSWSTQEEATVLAVPCLTLGLHPERSITVSTGSNRMVGTNRFLATRGVWDCMFNGSQRGTVPDLWDGRTATRIAGYLAAWLPSNGHQPCADQTSRG